MKKKIIALTLMAALTASLITACGGTKQETESASSAASSASSAVSESEPAAETEEPAGTDEADGPMASAINPWSDAASAEEAAKGAGLDGLTLAEDLGLDLGEEFARTYRYMDGMAEVTVEFPASQLTIRKGKDDGYGPAEGDISGDYTAYAYTWTQDVNGTEVSCAGNREGDSTKTLWSDGDICYSVVTLGLGGDDAFGLSEERVTAMVGALK